MVSLLYPVLLWLASWIDVYVLWRLPRDICYRYWLLRGIVLLTKWTLHLITGQSELHRLLAYRSSVRVEPQTRLSAKTVKTFGTILQHSSVLNVSTLVAPLTAV